MDIVHAGVRGLRGQLAAARIRQTLEAAAIWVHAIDLRVSSGFVLPRRAALLWVVYEIDPTTIGRKRRLTVVTDGFSEQRSRALSFDKTIQKHILSLLVSCSECVGRGVRADRDFDRVQAFNAPETTQDATVSGEDDPVSLDTKCDWGKAGAGDSGSGRCDKVRR